jgi:hypothetical protein
MSTAPTTPDASETPAPTPAPTPPPAQTPPTPTPAASGDQASWQQAAQPVATQDAATSSATIPGQPAPSYTPPPVVVTSQKPGGILGVMDGILGALTGTTKPEIGTDQEGNKYVKQTSLTHGQQWTRIAGEAIQGAAAGLAAGKGAGNMGRAAEAGVQAGQQDAQQQQQQEKDMTAEARQQNLDNANNQMLRQNMAEQAWRATRLKVEATHQDVQFAEGQVDRLVKEGGTVLGTAEHPGDIGGILKVNPDVMHDMIVKHQIEIMPHYNEDGSAGGITVVKMPTGYRTTMLPAGATFHTFDQTTGQYVEHKSADPMTAGERDDYEHAAGIAQQKFASDKQSAALKAAQTASATATANATTAKLPSEIRASNARADASEATAAKDRTLTGTGPGGSSPLVDSIGTGKIAPERMAYLLSRNPELLTAVTQKYPDFDGSKVGSYPAVYKEFTSTKKGTAGGALNAGGTALKHLKELDALNTVASHVPGTSAYVKYMNKADTLSTELAAFYGDSTIPAIQHIKSTLTTQVPGGRHGAITTQAQSMGDKFDSFEQQWKNAAPSSAYEAPMPNVDKDAKNARAALDPRYHARMVGEQLAAPGAGQAATIKQGEPTAVAADGKTTLVVRNGQWVPAQHQ